MWRNASPAERAPFVEEEEKQRAAYKEEIKKFRETQASVDAASRTSHHMVQQTQQPVYRGTSSFEPFPRVHSIEEAVQKVDRSFTNYHPEDYSPDPIHRHPQTNVAKGGPYANYRSYENEHPPYRPRRVLPTSATRGAYPFRPYPTGPPSSQAAYSPDSPQGRSEEGDQYPTVSRYFDRPRHSPYGFYQYP